MSGSATSRLPRAITAEQLPALVGIVALAVLAWVYLFVEAAGMAEMSAMMDGGSMTEAWTLGELGYLCVMWSIMMVAMMVPSALPTVLVVSKLSATRRAREPTGRSGIGITPIFVAGYLTIWTAYSVIAATTQWILHGSLLVSDSMASASPILSGGLLLAAGVFQFTSFKDRCVSHCRSPLSFLTQHWKEGRMGALRMGWHHGTYCVGCCWALMALLFVLGVMNLLWVTALAVLVLLEKTLPVGGWITRLAGVALVGWGAVVLWGAVSGASG